MCPLCNTAHEDEKHTLFYCTFLDDKNIFPENILYNLPMLLDFRACVCVRVTFVRMMQDKSCLHDLGRFIYNSNKRREV